LNSDNPTGWRGDGGPAEQRERRWTRGERERRTDQRGSGQGRAWTDRRRRRRRRNAARVTGSQKQTRMRRRMVAAQREQAGRKTDPKAESTAAKRRRGRRRRKQGEGDGCGPHRHGPEKAKAESVAQRRSWVALSFFTGFFFPGGARGTPRWRWKAADENEANRTQKEIGASVPRSNARKEFCYRG
jgi:hypothetical protein